MIKIDEILKTIMEKLEKQVKERLGETLFTEDEDGEEEIIGLLGSKEQYIDLIRDEMINDFEEKQYLIEKAKETTALLKPIFDKLRLPFHYTLEKQPEAHSSETIIIGANHKINVAANSVQANIMVAVQFLNEYFKNPSGYYNGSYVDKVQGLIYKKEELK